MWKQVKICDFYVSILRINWQIFLKNCDVEIPWIYHLRSGIWEITNYYSFWNHHIDLILRKIIANRPKPWRNDARFLFSLGIHRCWDTLVKIWIRNIFLINIFFNIILYAYVTWQYLFWLFWSEYRNLEF